MQDLSTLKKIETLTVEGTALTVLHADRGAWKGLESVLGEDPVKAWSLKVMMHTVVVTDDGPRVQFHAEFARETDAE